MLELEMKGDNMEIYCVYKFVRNGGNFITLEFMRLDKVWLFIRNFLFLCLGDKLYYYF